MLRPVVQRLALRSCLRSSRAPATYTLTRSLITCLAPKPTSQARTIKCHAVTVPRRYYASYPEHTKVALPALSPTMEEGTLISWEKKEGDKLNEGDLLAEIETDKATMAFETPEEGYLAKIMVPAGTKGVPVGKLVCIIVENEADVAAFKNFVDEAAKPAAAPAPSAAAAPAVPPPVATAPVPQAAPAAAAPAGGEHERVYASPMAKKLAEKRQIRLQGKGTGLFDSITSHDLESIAGAPVGITPAMTPAPISPGQAYIDIPVSSIRATIAKRLTLAKQTIPHYTVTQQSCIDNLLKFSKKYKHLAEKEGAKLGLNEIVIKAAAMACKRVPEMNSSWQDSVIRQYTNVDVSLAVATDKGLITPIVFEANNKTISTISNDVKALAARAREGKLQPKEFQGGTFSVSNLGMFGITHFTAIINPPQAAILAVGSTVKQLVLDEDSEKGFKESSFMNVTLSCDHRVVDGALAAVWMQHFHRFIEDPETMLV